MSGNRSCVFAKKRYAANTLIYHHHTNAPVIETYYPQPGTYARQRTRLAAQDTETDGKQPMSQDD